MKGILFVCIGNRLRSVLAEHIFSNLLSRADQNLVREINISSAGVVASECVDCAKKRGHIPQQSSSTAVAYISKAFFGKPPASSAVAAMAKRGIDLSGCRSREVDREMNEAASLILTAVKANKHGVLELFPETEGRVFTFMEFMGGNLYYLFDDCHNLAPELSCGQVDFGNDPAVTEALIAEVEESLTKSMRKIIDYVKPAAC